MEDKLREKKAIIEVLENMVSGMDYTLRRKQSEIDEYSKQVQASKDNGEEVTSDDWRLSCIASAQAYIDAYVTVSKHLEKLI